MPTPLQFFDNSILLLFRVFMKALAALELARVGETRNGAKDGGVHCRKYERIL
jgi:hypothetical protein